MTDGLVGKIATGLAVVVCTAGIILPQIAMPAQHRWVSVAFALVLFSLIALWVID